MNQTNQTNQTNPTIDPTRDNSSQVWEESGAMVYVALTVATLSAVIMCCVWFIKQRMNNGYGSLDGETPEEEVELRKSTTPVQEEEECESKSSRDVFTLEGSESGSDESVDLGFSDEPQEQYKDNPENVEAV